LFDAGSFLSKTTVDGVASPSGRDAGFTFDLTTRRISRYIFYKFYYKIRQHINEKKMEHTI